MDDVKGEDVNGEQGERHGEQVEVSVVPLAHTVSHPWAVVIETVCEKEKKVTLILCKACQMLHTNALRKTDNSRNQKESRKVLKIHQNQPQF